MAVLTEDVVEEEQTVQTEEVVTEEPAKGDVAEGVKDEPQEKAEGGNAPPDDEFSVAIGEEPEEIPHGPAPAWVKEMRKQNRELKRQLRQLQQAAPAAGRPAEIVLGEKPTLEGVDYDTGKYEADLAAWYAKKLKIDEQAARQKAEAEENARKWQDKLGSYERAKLTLGAEDYEDAEAVVVSHLDTAQQSIIVSGAKNAALLVYALGKNPAKAAALGAIKDPVEFAFSVARLEAQLKVSEKKPATPPETRVTGNGRVSGAVDATLERLRAEAERTGDYTKVSAYKRQKNKRS
ncbi:MAG: hypothetical protein RBT20_08005 [Syntrophales bacterium]|jgi:hypothetical protein|nr:hypothetical protein [Syntrophales bacterium]